MRTKRFLATLMMAGLVVGIPSTASAGDIPSCVNDYFWAGQADQSYRCATEHFGECVNDYFWAGDADQAWRCAVDVDLGDWAE